MDVESAGRQLYRDWLEGRLNDDRARIPGELWHYTRAPGVRGILESERLWATHARFLNDTAEIEYGVGVFVGSAQALDTSSCKPQTRRFIDGLIANDGAVIRRWLDANLAVYVCCFCASGDLLSQWRAYAGAGAGEVGYSLAFKSRQPQSWVQVAPGNQMLTLRRIRYGVEEQRLDVDHLLAGLVSLLDIDPADNSVQNAFSRCFIDGLAEVASCSKHPAFEEEQEWRIVYVRSLDSNPLPLKFRDARGVVIPYVELEVPEPVGARAGTMPIQQIKHGPSPDPRQTRLGLSTWIESLPKFSHVTIEGSLAPVRL